MQIHGVVVQQASDQEFHGQIVNASDAGLVGGVLGFDPTVHEAVADGQ